MSAFRFPRWVDRMVPLVLGAVAFGGLYVGGVVFVGAAPSTIDVGYRPEQPIPFSHALHAGKLKMDCRFCHTTVEKAAHAAIPPTATCGKCHSALENGTAVKTTVHPTSAKLQPVRDSLKSGDSVEWVKVHDLPDYAYFNHSAHVRRGVSCVSCHGRVDRMEVVEQVAELSMNWCLQCHRNPTPNIRPPELVTKLDWNPSQEERMQLAEKWHKDLNIQTWQNCSTCHR